MNNNNFKAIKAAMLAQPCDSVIRNNLRAISSLDDLAKHIKKFFHWLCLNKVLTTKIIETYQDDFAQYNIYANKDTRDNGFVICDKGITRVYDDATAVACGNATVVANQNTKIIAWDNAKVEAGYNSTVKACGNTTVMAFNEVTVSAWDNAKVSASNFALVEAWGNASVQVSGNAIVNGRENVSVKAYQNGYCVSPYRIDCELHDNAIHRLEINNTIYFASDNLKFEKRNNLK